MNTAMDICPYCRKTVMKGAMRCVSCGKLLKTPEEQRASIEKLQSREKSGKGKLLKWALLVLALGVLYHYYSEEMLRYLNDVIGE